MSEACLDASETRKGLSFPEALEGDAPCGKVFAALATECHLVQPAPKVAEPEKRSEYQEAAWGMEFSARCTSSAEPAGQGDGQQFVCLDA